MGQYCDWRRGQALLRAQADRNSPLGEPPEWVVAIPGARQAWGDLVAAAPPVLRSPDEGALAMTAVALSRWRLARTGGAPLDAEWLRLLYRMLGDFFVPIAARRRLLYGTSVPASRSRRA